MDHRLLTIEREGPTAVVTLNRPDRYNALSTELMLEVEAAALSFRDDVDTRAVIFTGAGKNFSAGMDLKDPEHVSVGAMTMLAKQRRFQLGPRLIRALREMNQITIAAINGAAMGGAACMASALDFRIGADDCRVGYPESNLAIPLSWVSLPLCVSMVGPARAKRWVITAEKLPASTLLEWGFLDEVVPPDQLLDRARELAALYAARPPIAAQMVKRSVNQLTDAHDQAIMHMDGDQVLLAELSEDFMEGVQSFLQKRSPEFKGK